MPKLHTLNLCCETGKVSLIGIAEGGDSYEAIQCLVSEVIPEIAHYCNDGEFDNNGVFHRVIHKIGGDMVFLLESLGYMGPNSTYWCGSCKTKGLANLFDTGEKRDYKKEIEEIKKKIHENYMGRIRSPIWILIKDLEEHIVYCALHCILAFGKATIKAYISLCFRRQYGRESRKLYNETKRIFSHLESKLGINLCNSGDDKFKRKEWQKYVLSYCDKMEMVIEKDLDVASMAKLILAYKKELESEANEIYENKTSTEHMLIKLQRILSNNGISINLLKCVENNKVSLIGKQAMDLFLVTDEIDKLLHFEQEDPSLTGVIHQMGRILRIICKNDPVSNSEGICNHVDMTDCSNDVDWVVKNGVRITQQFINFLGIPGFNYVHTLVTHMMDVLKENKTLGAFSGSLCESTGSKLKQYLHSYSNKHFQSSNESRSHCFMQIIRYYNLREDAMKRRMKIWAPYDKKRSTENLRGPKSKRRKVTCCNNDL